MRSVQVEVQWCGTKSEWKGLLENIEKKNIDLLFKKKNERKRKKQKQINHRY